MVQCNLAKAHCKGPILPSVCRACALRYFAGGAPYDIAASIGVAPSEVLEKLWDMVDAMNTFNGFNINFPQSHDKQYKIALGFKNKFNANFESCVRALDGILIWIDRPCKDYCIEAGCDAGNFFCGRKLKYRLNSQAICNIDGQFLDLFILHSSTAAECLAFEGMSVYQKLEDGWPPCTWSLLLWRQNLPQCTVHCNTILKSRKQIKRCRQLLPFAITNSN